MVSLLHQTRKHGIRIVERLRLNKLTTGFTRASTRYFLHLFNFLASCHLRQSHRSTLRPTNDTCLSSPQAHSSLAFCPSRPPFLHAKCRQPPLPPPPILRSQQASQNYCRRVGACRFQPPQTIEIIRFERAGSLAIIR